MIPSGSEILIILLAVLVLFGGKQLPQIARKMGQWMNNLQTATRDIKREIDSEISELDKDKQNDLKG